MKVAVITPQPTPYRDPFWNAVASQPGVQLDVFYCYSKTPERPWQCDWEMRFQPRFLPSIAFLPGGNGYYNRGLIRALKGGDYDAFILGGYNHFSTLAAAFLARRLGTPYFLMNEVYLAQPRSLWRKIVKGPLVRWVVRGAAGCLPTGSLATRYLLHYGAREDRLCLVPNVPDIDRLMGYAASLSTEYLEQERAKRGIQGKAILFVGRLIPLKRVDVLLQAAALVSAQPYITVLLAGTGPLEPALRRQAQQLGLANAVRFLGFVQPAELPYWYCLSDVFVLPSEDETWGVVVLEALACGTPVVTTNMVGAAPDVISAPALGSIVPAGDAQSLGAEIERHLRAACPRHELQAQWRPIAQKMTYSVLAENLVAFLRRTVRNESREAASSSWPGK